MKIAGFLKNSFIDYPGQIAAVVFTPGCNYDCYYCHNRALIDKNAPLIDENMVMAFLEKRIGLIDAVVITGGEPTLQKELAQFIHKVKSMGYLIKLDTNGSCSDCVQALLNEDLLDYIALDYKAPFDRYEEFCSTSADGQSVQRTLDIIKKSGIDYELRTTWVPQLSKEDIVMMLKEVAPVTNFALQRYKMPEEYKQTDLFKLKKSPHSKEEFQEIHELIHEYAQIITIR
ncbi:MAG: anaerobic ribonucleoside-triphosphate reductase activating protein [Clostridiales bacterium]|nr:anaerobic ribonucleoside-triphosphate reductase activating protein [Clostridiales bacterium]